jgi:hypothetical protein
MGREVFEPVESAVGGNANRALGMETVPDSRTQLDLRFSCATYSLDMLESKPTRNSQPALTASLARGFF